MKYGIRYDIASGEILAQVAAPAPLFDQPPGPGEAMLETALDDTAGYYVSEGVVLAREEVTGAHLTHSAILAGGEDTTALLGLPDPCHVRINGEPVEVTGGSLALSSETPGVLHVELVGRYRAEPWTVRAYDLAEWQREIRDQINKERDTRLNGGFVFGGIQFDTDERSRSFVMAAASALGIGIPLPDDFKWTSTDDIDVPMDAETFGAFAGSMMAWGNAVHTHSRALKIALETLTEPDDLRAFDPSAGWPPNTAEHYLSEEPE